MRGSGRTLRLLLKASLALSSDPSRRIYIVGHTLDYARDLCRNIFYMLGQWEVVKIQCIPISMHDLVRLREVDKASIYIDHYVLDITTDKIWHELDVLLAMSTGFTKEA